MSTYINVTVDGGGLSERAKAQTNANRQAKLESDNRQKVEAKGSDQRDATRAQQGLTATGQPQSGYSAKTQFRPDEPAASRFGRLAGVGNAWLWTAATEPFNLVSNGSSQTSYGYRFLTRLGCLDGTQWLELTDTYETTPPDLTDLSAPLPAPRNNVNLYSHAFTLNGYLNTQNYWVSERRFAFPVGPQALIYVYLRSVAFALLPTKKSLYGSPGSFYENAYTLSTETYSWTTQRAFFVGQSSVREITLPSTAGSLLAALTQTAGVTITTQNVLFSGFGAAQAYWNSQTGSFNIPRVNPTPQSPTNPDIAWLNTDKRYSPFLDNPEIANLNLRFNAYSAAVYPLLAYGSSWETNNLDPQATSIMNKAGFVVPSNTAAFTQMPNSDLSSLYNVAGDLEYTYGNKILRNSVSPAKIAQPIGNPPALTYVDSAGTTRATNWDVALLTTHDWANSNFCKQRLLSLGFSASDLTP
jgi:hypothetical protein